MGTIRQFVSGLYITLALAASTANAADNAPTTAAPPAPPAKQTLLADQLTRGALPLASEELGQISGGTLSIAEPQQLRPTVAGVKLWDEARIRPPTIVDPGLGQIMPTVTVQQTQFH